MSLVKKYSILPLILGLLLGFTVHAQPLELAAAMTVIGDTVTLQRSGTLEPFPLPDGAVTPMGVGDIITTGDNGRVFITFLTVNRLYLLPNSTYELHEFALLAEGQYSVDGTLSAGIAIQQFTDDSADWQYRLNTDALTILEPSNLFAVWALPEYLEAAISAEGELVIQGAEADEPASIPAPAGIFPRYGEEAITLEEPYHAAQLFGRAINCPGTISTGGSEGLRLRSGAALDYLVVDVLLDGQQVPVIGITENGLWYGIPYQTGLGWLYSSLVKVDCPNLPEFPNLVGGQNEEIRRVREVELELLIPFYGTLQTNPVFYR